MVGLLAAIQASRNDEWASLQTSIGLFLALHTQLTSGTYNNYASPILTLGNTFVVDDSINKRNQIRKSFAAPCGGLNHRVNTICQRLISLGLYLSEFRHSCSQK